MKFSELWLREWINLDISTKKLAEQITMIGLEVDSIEPVVKYFKGVIIGKIIECCKHPNNNNLYLTKVNIGINKFLNIICDANNCRTNILVVVAKIGAYLPDGSIIKKKNIHGKESEGILCSFAKLGLQFEDNKKIIELPCNAPIGYDVRKYLKFDDNIFNINITSNRSDCFGIIGIARDLSVYNRIKFIKPFIKEIKLKVSDKLPVLINEPQACPRYINRIIRNVNLDAPTPLWMKEKLRRCGIGLASTLVNISNYILLELGQPINIFLLNEIEYGIIIRFAEKNEFININGNKVVLSSNTLIISDYKKILTIAGVLNRSFIFSKNINDIVLESAFFQPFIVQNYSRKYNLLNNDVKNILQFYERGIDSKLQFFALEKFTSLLLSICGGEPGPIVSLKYKKNIKQPVIKLRRKKLYNHIGFNIPKNFIEDIMIRLGFEISKIELGWKVLVPSWRFDISIEEDLIEEIIRMYGYNTIPNIPINTKLVLKNCVRNDKLSLISFKTILIERGYYEVINYSFVNHETQSLLHPDQNPLKLLNPISHGMSVMRLSLWTGLLQSMIYNKNRQQHKIKLFEAGLTFIPDKNVKSIVHQNFMIAGIVSGCRHSEHWDLKKHLMLDFYDIKGDIESLIDLSGKLKNIRFISCKHPALHPGKSAQIYLNDEFIGLVGNVHPTIESKLKLGNQTLLFELSLDKISNYKIKKFKRISRFPINKRDISIIVENSINAGDIIEECKKVIGKKLFDINLFDVYQDKNTYQKYKSISISLFLHNSDHLMKTDEINLIVNNCVKSMCDKFNAVLRNEQN